VANHALYNAPCRNTLLCSPWLGRYIPSSPARGGTIGGRARFVGMPALAFSAPFGNRSRPSFSTRATNARRSAAVGTDLRGGRGGLVGAGKGMSQSRHYCLPKQADCRKHSYVVARCQRTGEHSSVRKRFEAARAKHPSLADCPQSRTQDACCYWRSLMMGPTPPLDGNPMSFHGPPPGG
jgi:hypothetical protein